VITKISSGRTGEYGQVRKARIWGTRIQRASSSKSRRSRGPNVGPKRVLKHLCDKEGGVHGKWGYYSNDGGRERNKNRYDLDLRGQGRLMAFLSLKAYPREKNGSIEHQPLINKRDIPSGKRGYQRSKEDYLQIKATSRKEVGWLEGVTRVT